MLNLCNKIREGNHLLMNIQTVTLYPCFLKGNCVNLLKLPCSMQLAYSESEREDLHHKLTQVRKMDVSVGSEMNKLKLHLATQQSCNTELEKRQKRCER